MFNILVSPRMCSIKEQWRAILDKTCIREFMSLGMNLRSVDKEYQYMLKAAVENKRVIRCNIGVECVL